MNHEYTENRDMMAATAQAIAEDIAYQAALDAGMKYVLLGNDGHTPVTYYRTWVEANAAAIVANECEHNHRDDKFWVEAA